MEKSDSTVLTELLSEGIQFQQLRQARNTPRYSHVREKLFASVEARYFKAIKHLAAKKRYAGIELEDLICAGLLGLSKALDGFDPDRGVPFRAYAMRCVENEIDTCLRQTGSLISVPAGQWDNKPQVLSLEVLSKTSIEIPDQTSTPQQHLVDLDGVLQEGGCNDGEVFRWAALLAPLPPSQRIPALKRFWSRSKTAGWSRCEGTWKDLGWAEWLRREDESLNEIVVSQLVQDLNSRDLYRREHAAFAVWVIHAVASVRKRCEEPWLSRLADALLHSALSIRDLGVQDTVLFMLCIKVIDIHYPQALKEGVGQPTFYRHVVRNAPSNGTRVWAAIETSLARLDQTPAQDDLYILWDGIGFLDKEPFSTCTDQYELPRKWRRRWGYLLTAHATRHNPEQAISRFFAAARESGDIKFIRENKTTMATVVRHLLTQNQSAQFSALLMRRTAAAMLRYIEPMQLQSAFLSQALEDQSVFVRHSLMSGLREQARRGEDIPFGRLTSLLQHYINSTRRPVELMGNILHILIIYVTKARPIKQQEYRQVFDLCRRLAKDVNPEMRGKALAWLGHLLRTSPTATIDDILGITILAEMKREYAVNIAHVLTTPIGLSFRPRPPEDYGITSNYTVPLWRTDWV